MDRCRHCDRKDTIQHRLIEFGDGEIAGMDKSEDIRNDENRPEAHTIRMVIVPTIQTVATTRPPGGFMGPGTVSAV
jgi:hypothetical protein